MSDFEELEQRFSRRPLLQDVAPPDYLFQLWDAIVVLVAEVRRLKDGDEQTPGESGSP